MDKFQVLPLGEFADCIFSGSTPKSGGDAYSSDGEGVLFIKSGCLSMDGKLVIDETSKIKQHIHDGIMRSSQLKRNDVLIAIVGATIGRVALFADDRAANINQAIAAVRVDEKRLLPEFLIAYLLSSVGQTYLEFLKRPVARANINLEEISKIGIPNISLTQQKKFVEKFYKIRDIRLAKLRQADELLYSLDAVICNALLITMPSYKERIAFAITVSDIQADNTMGAEYYHPERMATVHMMKKECLNAEKLDDIVSFQRDIVSSSDNGEKYLGLSGVQSHVGELSGIDEDAAGQAFRYQEEDVLYGRLRPYLNKVLLAEKSGICSTEFYVMRVKNKAKLLPAYLAAVMRSTLILSQTRHMMTGNTHPRISNDDVKNLYIPVPNIEIQKGIVSAITQKRMDARKLRLEAEQEWQESKLQFDKELLGESKE